MTLRNSILLLLISTLFCACFNMTWHKKYSITVYITSFDSAHVSPGNFEKKIKYSYEEYNSDSNLIYQELYTNEYQSDDKWGKLYEKTRFFYNGKQKIKAEIEGGTPYQKSNGWRERYKEKDIYEYSGGQLTKWLRDGMPHEEYKYNGQKEMIEKRVYFSSSDSSQMSGVRFTYSNGLKIKAEYFPVDTLYTSVDTFIYKNNKLVEKDSYTSKGKQTEHRVIIRDDKGRAVEEKWKDPYIGWRYGKNGKIDNDEFYQINKYFYDDKGRPLKTEFYDLGNLMTIYEFKYD